MRCPNATLTVAVPARCRETQFVKRLLLASNNPGKVKEFRRLLADCGWEVVTPGDLGIEVDVEERGETYAENARLKAQAFANAGGCLALADDSGLEVDALGGRPGLQSARYGGPGASDAERGRLLLSELAGVPVERRTARFRAVVALAWPAREGEAPRVRLFEGTAEGRIACAPRGSGGFGYDPVFLTASGYTAAELPPDEKDAISHRGQAVRKAAEFLKGMAG